MRGKMNLQRLFIYVFFGGFYSIAGAQESENLNPEPDPVFHHNLKVFLDPKSRQISVEDTITIPDSYRTNVQQFILNSDLTITDASVDVSRLSNSPDRDDSLGALSASTSVLPCCRAAAAMRLPSRLCGTPFASET